MQEHKVRQGECITSISEKYGLFWETVWNHPDNRDLKKLREDPNVLQPGDIINIPDKQETTIAGATEKRHRFRKKGVPAKVKLQLVMEDEPLKNQPFTLLIDKQVWKEGTTDGNGYVEASIPPGVVNGKIIVGPPENRISFGFDFGTLDPLDTDDGVLKRLVNMGYIVGDDPQGAIASFQEKEGLDVTGTINDATRNRVKEIFGQ